MTWVYRPLSVLQTCLKYEWISTFYEQSCLTNINLELCPILSLIMTKITFFKVYLIKCPVMSYSDGLFDIIIYILHLFSVRVMTVAPTSSPIRVRVLWSLWRSWTYPSRPQRVTCQPCNTSATWTRRPLRTTARSWTPFTRTASRKHDLSNFVNCQALFFCACVFIITNHVRN